MLGFLLLGFLALCGLAVLMYFAGVCTCKSWYARPEMMTEFERRLDKIAIGIMVAIHDDSEERL